MNKGAEQDPQSSRREDAGGLVTAHGRAWLFVPGDRPERFAKAESSGADQVILDLEDAVLPAHKADARASVVENLARGARCWVRINASGSAWHEDDLAALQDLGPLGVVVPKAEAPAALEHVAQRLGKGTRLVALVESALGLEMVASLATQPNVDRLAFGSIDFSLDIDADPTPLALGFARSRLVVASRAAGLPGPLDGITTELDPWATRLDARRAKTLGMGGKLCIHPAQVRPVLTSFRPSSIEVDYARRVVRGAASSEHGAVVVDGRLVDEPLLKRARRILAESTE